jgi:CCR4-NOT transcription complex subunit 1
MDAFVKLVVVLIRFSGDSTNHVIKFNLLNKVLLTIATVLLQDQETRGAEFHQLAYHRFFVMLLNDLTSPDVVFDAISFNVMQQFCNIYHHLSPSNAPGFAYTWLELISHRIFVSRLLVHTPQQKGWPMFQILLVDLFTFLAPFLRNSDLSKATQLLYKVQYHMTIT